VLIRWLAPDSPTQLWSQATQAANTNDWHTALRYWRQINATSAARTASRLSEAHACLALGFAAQAEQILRRAIDADPAAHEPWRLLLEILRVENRTFEVQQLGYDAYNSVHTESRKELLRVLTLGLLADLPDEMLRTTLQRWADADHDDVDARIALWQRIAAQPHTGDPDRLSLVAALQDLLTKYPEHIGVRDALITALADTGELANAASFLDLWPICSRDARYWRLRGRWELEYGHDPEQAAWALQRALVELPHDWQSWYRLARALYSLHRSDESHQAAETVARIREGLNPRTLAPQLDDVFKHLDDPRALREVAVLCNHVGLTRLAQMWLAEAALAAPSATVPRS
jgi:predicted Zn-dependent protease